MRSFPTPILGAMALAGLACSSVSEDASLAYDPPSTAATALTAAAITTGTSTLDKIPANQFKGLNWGYNRTQPDLGNYSRGILRLPYLDLADSSATVVQKTNKVLDSFASAGANTIRLPVNIVTVSQKWANYYHYVVTTALNRNFKVILCFWLPSSNKLDDIESVKAMWHALAYTYYRDATAKLYPLVFYELANEPAGYDVNGAAYLTDIRNIADYLAKDFPGIKKRILVGGTDYSAYPGPVAYDSDLKDCYLAVHFYDTWAHDYSTTLKGLKYYPKYFDDALMYQIGWYGGKIDPNASSWYGRIIMTEFGEWTDRNYGYTSKTTRTATTITPKTTYTNDVEGIRIAYIYGTAAVVNRLQLGSVMWGGLIEDGYSLFKITSTGLARNDLSTLTNIVELSIPLKSIYWGPKSTSGTYTIQP